MSSKYSGMGKEAIKQNNIYAILKCVYHNNSVSRRDIAKAVKLTPSSVTLLVNELILTGLICEGGEIEEGTRAGRRTVSIEFNPNYGFFLGVSIERDGIVVALTNSSMKKDNLIDTKIIKGEVLDSDLLETVFSAVDNLLSHNQEYGEKLLAIGISLPGWVNSISGETAQFEKVFGGNETVVDRFRERYNVSVFVDNNVRCLAQSELDLFYKEDTVDGLFIKHAPGFGCSVIIDSNVYRGADFFAGEIGHTKVINNDKLCICGKTGCLSTVVSVEALAEGARNSFSPSSTPELWRLTSGVADKIDIPIMLQSAMLGDAPIKMMLQETLGYFAGIIQSSLLLLNGSKIICFGEIFENEWFLKALQLKLDSEFSTFRKIELVTSKLWENNPWLSSAMMAFKNFIQEEAQK